MKKTLLFSIIILTFVIACTPTPEKVEEPQPQKIILGAMFPLSGEAAAYGEPLVRQLQITIDEINAAGGINGQQIELKIEDSKCNPKDGTTAAQKLIEVDKVKVIFGGACSGETLGAAPIAEQNKIIIISPSATSPALSNAGDYIFRTAPSDAYAGQVAAETALTKGYKKAAIINENTDYPQGLAKVFDQHFKKGNGTIVATESYETDVADFKTLLLKVKAKKPDVIYIVPQTPAKGVLLVKQIKEQGLKQQLITAEVMIGRDVIKENAKLLDNLIGIEQYVDENAPITKKTLDAYRAKHGEVAWPFYQSAMRDAVFLVVNSIKKNGLDTDKIKTDLYATKDWEGAVGKLTIDSYGDAVLKLAVRQVKNGTLIEV